MQHSKLTARILAVAEMFDVSVSTIRRRMKDDPSFPKPFRMAPNGDLLWSVAELEAYVAAKSARARAA
jgi:predicted DNA-binding transcriptional regulator AlpA